MDERPQEKTSLTGLDNLLTKLYQPVPLIILFIILFFGLIALGYSMLTEPPPPPQTIPITESSAPTRVYEEDRSEYFEDKVKQADLAIIEALRDLEISLTKLDLRDVEIRNLNGEPYHYQVLQFPDFKDRALFIQSLIQRLQVRVLEALVTDNGSDEALITIDSLPTHRLLLKSETRPHPKGQVHQPRVKGPKVAVVIDDIGENLSILKGLVRLDFPVTLAVWPNATHTRAAVEIILQKRRDLIIHFPMEPRGYPRYNPGNDALFAKMSDDEIQHQIAASVAKIPEAIGVNNHMGSRFTELDHQMKVALSAFKQHGLFFLDSLTSGKSIARSASQKADIPFYERDIFIDNVKDVNAIIHQLKKAENVARKRGFAIAIGHPYRETLSALKQWGGGKNISVQLVPLSSLTPENN